MIPENQEWLDKFLIQNGPIMTVGDIIEETGLARHVISKRLDFLGIVAPKLEEIQIKFLMENKGKISRDKAIKMLNLQSWEGFRKLLQKASLSPSDFPVQSPVKKYPIFKEIFSDFKKDPRAHYNHEQNYKSIEDYFK